MEDTSAHTLRIGELSRRTDVTPELLRAWERRYGLLRPLRTQGGFRLYSLQDLDRVMEMKRRIAGGMSPSEAARFALNPTRPQTATTAELSTQLRELEDALDHFNEVEAQAALDRAFSIFGLELVLRDIVVEYLRSLGERWAKGEISIAQEHFASNIIRGRLMGLARGWEKGYGPSALLSCLPGERHDLPLIIFGLALRELGWKIMLLGADTPISSISGAATATSPDLIVIGTSNGGSKLKHSAELKALAHSFRLAVAGSGAVEIARIAECDLLEGDPVTAASVAAERFQR